MFIKSSEIQFSQQSQQQQQQQQQEQQQEQQQPTFGKIKIDMVSVDETGADIRASRNIVANLWLDNSGSMSDICADRRSKMKHVIFTADQMIRKMQEENSIPPVVSVFSFEHSIKNIVDAVRLDPTSVDEIIHKINKIIPAGDTNIEKVFMAEGATYGTTQGQQQYGTTQGQQQYGTTQGQQHPDRVFIMVTDGQATSGEFRTHKLLAISDTIPEDTRMIMVGVGLDHDYALLSSIAKRRKNSTYKFISNIEDISLACSELIFNMLNSKATKCHIIIKAGEIYDWVSNVWRTYLDVDDFVVGCSKTFHVRSSEPDKFEATILGISIETGEPFEHTITDTLMGQDLTRDSYRQKTMELLFEATAINLEYTTDYTVKNKRHREFKGRLTSLITEMKKYMDENALRDDKMMQLLCDDIFTCHQTIGVENGAMYSASRQTSQGSQGVHSNSLPPAMMARQQHQQQPHNNLTHRVSQMNLDEDEEMKMMPTAGRQTTVCISRMNQCNEDDEFNFSALPSSLQLCSMSVVRAPPIAPIQEEAEDDKEEDVFKTHQMMASDDSPYATQRAHTFMREVSTSSSSTI